MKKRWRRLLVIAGVSALPVVLLLVVVHLPPVQRWAWQRVADEIADRSGWRVTADVLRARLWPARLRVEGLRVSVGDGPPVVTVDSVVARWGWLRLVTGTPRIEHMAIAGVTADLRRLPPAEVPAAADAEPVDPWHLVEIGELELESGWIGADAADVELTLEEVGLDGSMVAGSASLNVIAARLVARRDDRTIGVGPVELRVRGDDAGVVVDRLRAQGESSGFDLSAALEMDDAGFSGRAELELHADIDELARWWDPELAGRFDPQGRVELKGVVGRTPSGELELAVEHVGQPFGIAGYELDTLRVGVVDGQPRALVAGSSWGEVSAAVAGDGAVQVKARVTGAPVDPSLALLDDVLTDRFPRPLTLDGEVDVTVPIPLDLDRIEAVADLVVGWDDGSIRVQGSGNRSLVRLTEAELTVPGATVTASGRVRPFAEVDGRIALAVDDPGALVREVAEWAPAVLAVSVAGGPLVGELVVSGSWRDPGVRCEIEWQRPAVQGVEAVDLRAEAAGSLDRLLWEVALEAVPGARLTASGSARPRARQADGMWTLTAPDVAALGELIPEKLPSDLHGSVGGEGEFSWSEEKWLTTAAVEVHGASSGELSAEALVLDVEAQGRGRLSQGADAWHAAGRLDGREASFRGWNVDRLSAGFEADAESVVVDRFELYSHGGRLDGSASFAFGVPDGEIAADLWWTDLDLGTLPVELPPQAVGTVSGALSASGTVTRPEGELWVDWKAAPGLGVVEQLTFRAVLAEGDLELGSGQLLTAAGPLLVSGRAPMGALPRPAWLWPDAPSGPVRATIIGHQLRSAPVLTALGMAQFPLRLTTDLLLDVHWDLADPDAQVVELQLAGFRVDSDVSTIVAGRPVVVTAHGRRVELEPVSIVGPRFHLAVEEAVFDLGEQTVRASADLVLDPDVARLVPIAMHIDSPLYLALRVEGPLSGPDGHFEVDHSEGVITVRDPPLELAGLVLEGDVDDGVVSITSGEATLNRGRLYFGGGWDPESGQGVILELDNVTFVLPYGIVSRWSGELALEPDPERLVEVVGELVLDGGVWDQPVDLTGLLLGPGSAPVAADDFTHEIGLDLSIRGRGGIAVNNNLGDFNVGWSVLNVGGTAATPVIEGEVRLASGGEIALGGRRTRIRRGVIEFTGEAGAEPRVEIVPEEGFGEGGGEGFDAELAARKGLARGLGQVLGLENETLNPAEIAIQTETDPGTSFMVGQRISRQIALFFAADLSNPQDQVTTLQLWNLRGLPGLALQGYTETARDSGFAAIESIRWGGTEASDDRPMIHKIKLEGDWPISRRRLRRATGLDRGQVFDDFMLFVASLRLEREMAAAGYFDARVVARTEGDERLPKLVFECDPGERQVFEFEGDRVRAAIRSELVLLYQPPPFETSSLNAMRDTLDRRLAGDGFPAAMVSVARVGEAIVVTVDRGRELELLGPAIEGLPPDVTAELGEALGGSAQLAALLQDPVAAEVPIARVLRNVGFQHAEVERIWAEDLEAGKAMVRVAIAAGPRSEVTEVRLEGDDPLGLVGSPEFQIRPGVPLDRRVVDVATSRLRRKYRDQGFTEVTARSRVAEVEPNRWLVELRLEPGPKREVTEIEFTGLRHLSEKMLRRTLSVAEGDLLTTAELDEGVVQLASFPPVERVDARTVPEGTDGSQVLLHVTEKPRWSVGLGTRWGTDRGLEVLFDLRDGSLLGRGVTTNLRGIWGNENKRIALLTGLPPPPGRRLSLGLVLNYEQEDLERFFEFDPLLREERSRASFESGYALTESSTVRAYLRVTRTHVFEIDPLEPDFAVDETFDILTVGGQYIRDRLDDPFDPRSGYYFAADLSRSTELSEGEVDYLRSLLTGSLVLEPLAGWTWAQTLRIGLSDPLGGSLPPTRDARFFAGGRASIRGFPLDSVGPEGFLGNPVGGGALFLLNEELRVPVWRMVRVAVFADGGNVWPSWSEAELELAVGGGVGLRLSTPVGLVWGDVAWPLVDPGDVGKGVEYYFGIGKTF